MSDLEETTTPGVSRRTVTKAMAWSVPAVALAVSAPAMAASPCIPVITFGAQSCKCPGNSDDYKFGYVLQLCALVSNGCDIPEGSSVTITAIKNNSNKPLTPVNGAGYPITVPVSTTCSTTPILFVSESSASTLIVTYSVDGGASQVVELPAPPQECAECNVTA